MEFATVEPPERAGIVGAAGVRRVSGLTDASTRRRAVAAGRPIAASSTSIPGG